MTGYPEPEQPESATDWLPLPAPEFDKRNFVIRVIAAILCVLLMGWVATR